MSDLETYMDGKLARDIERAAELWLKHYLPQLDIISVDYTEEKLTVEYQNKVENAEKLITEQIARMKDLGNSINKIVAK